MTSLFRSERGKQEILQRYDQKLESLNIDYSSINMSTQFGMTHILVTGNPEHPPIIIVHGSNGCAPIALETYSGLHRSFRVYAVDVLAQPNKSDGTRLSMKDDSYGKWMQEIITTLNLDDVTMAGFSFGGLVILKTLEYDESRIREVYLSAPAYIVNGNPFQLLFKVFLPMKRFMKTKKPRYVEKFLANVFTDRDEFAIDYLSTVFLEFDMDFTPVPVIDSEKAKKINTPITLIAAGQDILFPGKKMIKRAKRIFPSLKNVLFLEQSKHVQNKEQNERIQQMIINT